MLKYGHSCINYGYVCEIVDINNIYIYISVLKYNNKSIYYRI